MKAIDMLSPSHQNSLQKFGFIVSIALAIIVTFLHYPFDGYVTERSVTRTIRYALRPCPYKRPSYEEVTKMNAEQLDQLSKEIKVCNDEDVTEVYSLPVSEWKTEGPLLAWLGVLTHFMATLISIVLMGVAWLWVFRRRGAE